MNNSEKKKQETVLDIIADLESRARYCAEYGEKLCKDVDSKQAGVFNKLAADVLSDFAKRLRKATEA